MSTTDLLGLTLLLRSPVIVPAMVAKVEKRGTVRLILTDLEYDVVRAALRARGIELPDLVKPFSS